MTRNRAPCGTKAAEARHRGMKKWPCQTCLHVRADIFDSLHHATTRTDWLVRRYGPLMRWGLFTAEERLAIAREVARTGVDVKQFGHILGLRFADAQQLHAAFALKDRASPISPG